MTVGTRRRVVLLAVLLAACGGGTAPGTEPEETTATTTATTSAEPESLADFFGWPTGDDPDAAQAQYEEQERKVQELVRSCMADEGFEWVPFIPPQPEGSFAFDEEEYVSKQGFGITTWYGNEEQFSTPAVEITDPNQAIVEAMSESEREAYYEVLYGPPDQGTPQVDPETGETYYVNEGFGAGCYGQAQEEIYGNQNLMWEELGPAFEEMYTRIQADVRVVEANQGWSSCMAGKGYEYESSEKLYEEVYQDFQARFDAIVGPNGGYADPFAGWTQEQIEAFVAGKSEEELNAFYLEAQEQAQSNIDQEALESLQQEEIEVAIANYECSGPLREVMESLTEEYEAEFIATHRQELETIREAQGG